MRNPLLPLICAVFGMSVFGCQQNPPPANETTQPVVEKPENKPPVHVVMRVEGKGEVKMDLDANKAPATTARIAELISQKFYDGQRVHRVEDWVIQWGDPQSKQQNWKDLQVGTQGSGKDLPFESNDIPMTRGVVAMASTGEQVGGDSQIFILTKDMPGLQGGYAAFGRVTEGMDVVDKIKVGDKITMEVAKE